MALTLEDIWQDLSFSEKDFQSVSLCILLYRWIKISFLCYLIWVKGSCCIQR